MLCSAENAETREINSRVGELVPCTHNRGLEPRLCTCTYVHTCVAINRAYIYYMQFPFHEDHLDGPWRWSNRIWRRENLRVREYIHAYIRAHAYDRAQNCACTRRPHVNYAHDYHSRIARADKWDTRSSRYERARQTCTGLSKSLYERRFAWQRSHFAYAPSREISNDNISSYTRSTERLSAVYVHVIRSIVHRDGNV